MNPHVAALDDSLATAGEWITLRRIVGASPNSANIDVECRARVDALNLQQIVPGISQDELTVILSPTQINNAQWPGGEVAPPAPFNVDPRIPRKATDKVIIQGKLRIITFVDAKFIGDELVRINLRVLGKDYGEDMNQVATYWPPGLPDGLGGIPFNTPIVIACRWEGKSVLYIDTHGKEVASSGVVYPDRPLLPLGWLALGNQSGFANPRALPGSKEIRQTGFVPSLDAIEQLDIAWL